MLVLTGPVLVLLLAFIGSRTRAVSRRRFAELRWMSGYFLDMLRGIATLKMFGRSAEQVDNMRTISRQFGETTLEVLRSAFQTGLVLDWAGAVAMALVAVEVSLRLMAGSLPFERALAVLIITPEFFLPLRDARAALPRGVGRAGGRRAAVRDPRRRRCRPIPCQGRARPRGAQRRVPRPPAIAFDRVTTAIPAATGRALDDAEPDDPGRGAGCDRRADRRRQVDDRRPAASVPRTRRWHDPRRGRPILRLRAAAWRSTVAWVPQSPHLFHGTVADNLRLARPDATTRTCRRRRDLAGARRRSSTTCRPASRHRSARAASG